MTPSTAIAQLRHLYNLSGHGGIYPSDVRNLLTPVIEALEAAHTPGAAPQSAAVVVKPLVWHRFGLSLCHARHADVTIFSIERRPDHYWLDFAPASKRVSQSTHPTLEAAQAAAQEQWEIFVRGALQP